MADASRRVCQKRRLQVSSGNEISRVLERREAGRSDPTSNDLLFMNCGGTTDSLEMGNE